MVSVLRTLQAEWNELVPTATALGIRRVRTLNLPLETIEYRRTKLEWLRGEIARLSTMRAPAIATTFLTPVIEQDLSALTFGVELELLMPVGMNHMRLAMAINTAGIVCQSEGYNHNTGAHWKVVTDGSLGDYTRGAEIVSPVLRGEDGFRQLQKVCDVAKQAGCKISQKCGLHVHVGARELEIGTVKNLVRLYAGAEGTIDSFMAPSRRGPQAGRGFCKSLRVNARLLDRASTMDDIARAIGQSAGRHDARNLGRYCKLNLQSFWQHGTVEFRHHQGTVEAEKALNWVKVCLRMVLAARGGADSTTDFAHFFETIRSPETERAFFQGRRDFFTGQVTRNEQRVARARTPWTSPQAPIHRVVETNVFEETGTELSRRATTSGQA